MARGSQGAVSGGRGGTVGCTIYDQVRWEGHPRAVCVAWARLQQHHNPLSDAECGYQGLQALGGTLWVLQEALESPTLKAGAGKSPTLSLSC